MSRQPREPSPLETSESSRLACDLLNEKEAGRKNIDKSTRELLNTAKVVARLGLRVTAVTVPVAEVPSDGTGVARVSPQYYFTEHMKHSSALLWILFSMNFWVVIQSIQDRGPQRKMLSHRCYC